MSKPIALVTLLLTLLVAPAPAGNLDLPDLGDPSGGALSPQEEALLGKAFMRRLRATSRVMEDPLWNGYLQELGSGLTAHSDQAAGAFTFFLVRDPEVNAFAGPAGHIGIHTGLVLATESEAELASVLAHEIAHVTQNHLRRAFDDAGRLSLPAAAAILAGIVLGAMADNPQVGAAAVAGVQAGLIQHRINFTRENEQEADRIGMQILAGSGYDPTAMPVFFGRLGKANRLYDSGRIPEFLRTHPVTENRIADSHARAEEYPYRQRPDSLEYHLLRASLEVARHANPGAAVASFRSGLQEGRYRNEEAQRYGYVLALMQARRFETAEQELDRLLRGNPLQVAYLLAQTELLRETGQSAQALGLLKDARLLLPGSYPLTLAYGELLIEQGKPAEAQALLERELRFRSEDARLYALLGRAAGGAGNIGEGHLYLAESHYLNGALEAAVRQLEAALAQRNLDYYEEARLSARLRELRRELEELERAAAAKGRGR
jgi:beta-barrel assembly-enhancing protease